MAMHVTIRFMSVCGVIVAGRIIPDFAVIVRGAVD